MSKIIGFTGTRKGMTEQQKAVVRTLVEQELEESLDTVGEHGDCIGADADFDTICVGLGMVRWCRPCNLENLRAYTLARAISAPVSSMIRNRAIVTDAQVVIACPPNFKPLRSGSDTWATIRMAKQIKRRLFIIYPDGTTKEYFQ